MPFRTFTVGEVLTASNVQTYLMNQAVITCTSGSRPASPPVGMVAYETDTNWLVAYGTNSLGVLGWTRIPWIPGYIDYTPTFYSNVGSATAIAGGSVAVTSSRYTRIGTTVHFYGHATINTTTAGGFGLSLPLAVGWRSFALSSVSLHGPSGYSTASGDGHVPAIAAPYNRFGPVSNGNALLNVVASGDTCHWNVMYETSA